VSKVGTVGASPVTARILYSPAAPGIVWKYGQLRSITLEVDPFGQRCLVGGWVAAVHRTARSKVGETVYQLAVRDTEVTCLTELCFTAVDRCAGMSGKRPDIFTSKSQDVQADRPSQITQSSHVSL
jgi:hypothetical protein